jgi:predicted ATPase
MLNRIEIRNFKAIQDSPNGTKKPLILDNLAQVNYLVGKNGCGKSSVLEGIHLFWMSKNSDIYSERFQKIKTTMKYGDKSEFIFQIRKQQNILKIEVSQELIIKQINISDNFSRENTDLIYLTNHPKWTNFELYEFCLKHAVYDNIDDMDQTGNFLGLLGNYGILFNQFSFSSKQQIASVLNCNKKFSKLVNSFINKYSGLSSAIEFNATLDQNIVVSANINNKNSYEEGKIHLSNFIYACIGDTLFSNNKYNKIVLIEEPENHIHPDRQKEIPIIIDEICKELDSIGIQTQFLISTHSPFIISAAANLGGQNVYLIKDGQTCDKNEFTGKYEGTNIYAGSKGYKNKDIIGVSAKMLGAGLQDVAGRGIGGDIKITKTNKIIYCEGSDNNKFRDDEIYQTIFGNEVAGQRITFVSCGSCDNVLKTYEIGKELNQLNKNGLEISYIVDGDDKPYEPGKLSRYSLESFLYDPQVLSKYDEKNGTSLSVIVNGWNFEQDNIKNKVIGSNNKFPKNKKIFTNCLAQIIRDMRKDQSDYIPFEKGQTDPNNIYWQLHTCIFGEK